MARLIALLRAVNVGGRKLPMAELRALCAGLGWKDVRTYIQSGNLVFEAGGSPEAVEARLEQAIKERFGFHSDVMVRSAASWAELLAANPFAEASQAEPSRVLVGLPKGRLRTGAAEAVAARASAGERVEEAGGALWFHYPAGVGTSKLTPALIDRAAGSPVTARNWRTMLELKEMAEA
ncbi:MAG TPA: DUF1697 domain-containing protein [Allosphingosinicella sp.]|jgi:uncharacterized protein (DUF1697 family)|nr:DUF1697 domain-containing protein [Allosphingosinicella sp.]